MQIVKRNGTKESFNIRKIASAVKRALDETHTEYSPPYPMEFAKAIEAYFVAQGKKELSIDEIQDQTELFLISDFPQAGKAYLLYRKDRENLWKYGWDMTDLQRDIYESKYRYKKETFKEFVERVAINNRPIQKAILEKKFIPAGRILAGRGLHEKGRKLSYFNCYVTKPPEDNIESIWDAAKHMARTFSAGGGCGTDLSKLRPKNALVNNAAQTTSGAVSFMDLYSLTTGLIGQSGRRGALMLTLSSRHPDIEEFIKVKSDLEKVTFANISVRVDSELMELAKKPFGSIVDLLYRPNQQNPEYEGALYTLQFKVDATGEVIEKKVGAKYLISLIAANIWDMAEPGLAFWDRIESWHLKSEYDDFKFVSTNPCGEQPLSADSACCLSSINLSEFVLNPFTDDAKFDYCGFKKVVRNGVVFLNEILDEGMKHHPLQSQRDSTKKYREIGLGFLGLADMFIKMGVKYGSLQSIEIIDEIMYTMINESAQESALLAQIYGSAPAFREKEILNSEFAKENFSEETKKLISKYGLRNTQILTVAPTGSISTMLGASGGIEPLFQVSFNRRTLSINEGEETVYKVFSPVVKELMEAKGIVEEKDLPDYVITAHDLNGKDRINIQGAIQKRVDAAISSTINLKEEATVQDIYDLIIYGYEQGLKGITFYRDGCARAGILTTDKKEKKKEAKEEIIIQSTGKTADICTECGGTIIHNNGCFECQDCGASACSL